jgi:type VI secretion system protein VasD
MTTELNRSGKVWFELSRSFFWTVLLVVGFIVGLMGCASAPKPVVSTLQITIEAAADVNPDTRRRASPVTVRVYALKTTAAFDSADFFALFEKDQATLGAEMLSKEEMLLRPGESKVLSLKLGPEAKSIAYFAAYRDLEKASWRGHSAIAVGQQANLKIKVLQKQIVAQ